MSEARQNFDSGGVHRSNARLKFVPNEALTEHLAAFHHPSVQLTMKGRVALFLYSERAIPVVEPHHDLFSVDHEAARSLLEVDQISRAIHDRSRMQRRLATTAEFKKLPEDDPGMLLRMGVIVDELTARALQGTVLLDDDGVVPVGLVIPRAKMAHGHQLLEARDGLVELLGADHSAAKVDSMELIQPIAPIRRLMTWTDN